MSQSRHIPKAKSATPRQTNARKENKPWRNPSETRNARLRKRCCQKQSGDYGQSISRETSLLERRYHTLLRRLGLDPLRNGEELGTDFQPCRRRRFRIGF